MHSYTSTDQLLHLLCQTIAKVNKAKVPEKADDSHTNLYFDPVSKRILGRWFSGADGQRLIMALNLKKFRFEYLTDDFRVLSSTKIAGRTLAETEVKLAQKLTAKGGLSQPLSGKMHYDIPHYSFAEEVIRRPLNKNIANWCYYRQLANAACYRLMGYLQTEGEARIWPHHFDTGIYVQPNDRLGVGFGLAMADDMIDKPYFYLSGYGLNDHMIDYSGLPKLKRGEWKITDGFKGAVLPLSLLENRRMKKAFRIVDGFQQTAYKIGNFIVLPS